MKRRYLGKTRRPLRVYASNLQLCVLHEMRQRKLTTLDEIGEYIQVTAGSLRFRGYIVYKKKCSHGSYCECEGQGYVLTALGESVDDLVFGNGSDVHRVNTERPLSRFLQEDEE